MKLEESANYTAEEMMIIAAARRFRNRTTCFVGVGLPSVAACVARETHAPDLVLVYESGAMDAKPTVPPLSIADLELAETASFLVSVPEIFAYWLQGGRIQVGVLGAAQIDRFGNINSTVIGNYSTPKVRMPGAGGAPQIAANVDEVLVIVRQNPKTFVSRLDFVTTPRCKGFTTVVSDMGIFEAGPAGELALRSIHPGTRLEEIREATRWPLKIADVVCETSAPSRGELARLRELNARVADHLRQHVSAT